MVEIYFRFLAMALGTNMLVFPIVYLFKRDSAKPPPSNGEFANAFLAATILLALVFMWFGKDFFDRHPILFLGIPVSICYLSIEFLLLRTSAKQREQ